MQKRWQAKWIAYPGINLTDSKRSQVPAPVFRRNWVAEKTLEKPEILISGLGFFSLEMDGIPLSDEILSPAPSQYDKRWRYRRFRLNAPIVKGERHIFSVTLGNGLYNDGSETGYGWHFDKADWRAYPKLIFQLEDRGTPVLCSDSSWIVSAGPIVFDSLRLGEVYDARLELDGCPEAAEVQRVPVVESWFPDKDTLPSSWFYAAIVPPPGGVGEEQLFPPCRPVAFHAMKEIAPGLWAAPANCSAVPEIRVRGSRGASIELICGERLSADGDSVDLTQINSINDRRFQRDQYILKGCGVEEWHPQFTFHGFQYVQVTLNGDVELVSLRQAEVHTNFSRIGEIASSDHRLTRLEESAIRSDLSNFCGFPMDCPTREKGAWTQESMLMCETLCYTHDAVEAYHAYAAMIGDTQRPSGQLSCMAPCSGSWGYNWFSGSHWDFALFDIPWTLWLFSGRTEILEELYPKMVRNLEFLDSIAEDGYIVHGLSDWLVPDKLCAEDAEVPHGFIQSACYIASVIRCRSCAEILGKGNDARMLEEQEIALKKSFNQRFYLGQGKYRGTISTVPAMALRQKIVPDEDRALCVEELRKIVCGNGCRVDYGTAGSRQVPRAMFENGLIDEAFALMTQSAYPGYQYWFDKLNLTSFPESWSADAGSLNHGAFSDIVGCMYRYLGGLRHAEDHPGAHFMEICPLTPSGLSDFSASHQGFVSSWKRVENKIQYKIVIPAGGTGRLILPGREVELLSPGEYLY